MFPESDFEAGKVKFTFTCEENPLTGQEMKVAFENSDFKSVPASTGMFKLAARHLVKTSTESSKREKISLKYQVLSPETAFVGVVKEDGEITEELFDLYNKKIAEPEMSAP